MIRIITILALCLAKGYDADVGTATTSTPSCSASVYVTPSKNSELSNFVKGNYGISIYDSDEAPIFINQLSAFFYDDGLGKLGSFASSIKMLNSPMFYLKGFPGVCLPYGFNENFTAGGYSADAVGMVNVKTPTKASEDIIAPDKDILLPPDWCEPCKQVLDGPMEGNYLLAGWNDNRCEDRCLYWNNEGRHFCFEAGSYQVLLECPAHKTPTNATNEPITTP